MQNKIMKIVLPGGLLGWFSGDAKNYLEEGIKRANEKGWKVVQIEAKNSKNLFNYIIDFIILILTFFIYSRGSEYLVKLEYQSSSVPLNPNESLDYGDISLSGLKTQFENLDPKIKRSIYYGYAVLLIVILSMILYKTVPGYLEERRERMMNEAISKIIEKEPSEISIYIPEFYSNIAFSNQSLYNSSPVYGGTYTYESEEGDQVSSESITYNNTGEDQAILVWKKSSSSSDGENMNSGGTHESVDSLKNVTMLRNTFSTPSLTGRFVSAFYVDQRRRSKKIEGLLANGHFYAYVGNEGFQAGNLSTLPNQGSKPSYTNQAPEVNSPPVPSGNSNNQPIETGIVTGQGVRVRSSMDKSNNDNVIDKLAKGTQVEILERNGEWFKIRVNGKIGYIWYEFIQ